jgi:hypothetical protein
LTLSCQNDIIAQYQPDVLGEKRFEYMLERRAVTYLLLFAIIFSAFSAPFLLGMMRPTFKERNPYSVFYAFCNLPVTFLLGGFIHSLSEYLWDVPTPHQFDLVEYVISLFFWSMVGMILGFYKDIREGKSN